MKQFFGYSPEVKSALENKKPVLALESTIISHGMPYPDNYETAQAVEHIVREYDVTPATIAVIDGKIKMGLTENELHHFASNKEVLKASRRDLPFVVANRYSAGTTVAATLFCAAKAGIKLFATGGIGGVHRGDAQDISADLIEISRTPIAVICAGAKAILDLPRTLEFLETMSVPVIGYRTQVLPAFYTDSTQYSLSTWVEDVPTLAQIVTAHWDIGMSSGVLITNPIPAEFNIPLEVIEPVIMDAIHKAEQNNISGKALTPFLLAEVAQLTQGKSLLANIALIKNNARLGAELARAVLDFQLSK
ncbi:pseudouridine-5'-phosphate glycosidase [Legionella anisa]|uniref:Pseudouridine-5'-phosphate glycosidase n=1 Tax=Legionella anisa TaxID=28082 RepID=A0AAX0WP72_9GAMM|nr:pseudouridine-5'-phosphate glycosidase [Legionella anisa]AWN75532.1 pseudouridine-5'-phosphate glycosidase [Legionella anisa]KTC76319.1 AraC family transcriptional regulator [Legionella anisa]MBN5937133.1 pseudouridine-5'-phosphate glycosidase [Legionella anisa]MCW8424277.1 pseudouridine-5'-phosphate glycosidase [Legionella anisa]MCW8446605.1 pseudouridine-5'-phosphate glycosidase [Legionella anisa]